MKSCKLAAGCVLLLPLAGCSHKPAGVSIPKWNPSEFARAALEKLDKSGDAQIDQRELTDAPGLAFGARFIDKNGDGKLGRDELIGRFTRYRDSRVGLTPKELRITHNGQPLIGAEVRLVPEFFLTDLIEPATGKTISQGTVHPSIAGQPTALMRVGYYRVEVVSDSVKLPPKFNTATTIGVEISPFDGEPAASGAVEIQLRDKKQ